MKTYDPTYEQLAMISVVQREWAAKNPPPGRHTKAAPARRYCTRILQARQNRLERVRFS
jgi:hypothetical protein